MKKLLLFILVFTLFVSCKWKIVEKNQEEQNNYQDIKTIKLAKFKADSLEIIRKICKTWVYSEENKYNKTNLSELQTILKLKISKGATFTFFDNGIFMCGNRDPELEPFVTYHCAWRLKDLKTVVKFQVSGEVFEEFEILKLTDKNLILKSLNGTEFFVLL